MRLAVGTGRPAPASPGHQGSGAAPESRPEKKRLREKRRREALNVRFEALQTAIGCGASARMDKESVLEEAVYFFHALDTKLTTLAARNESLAAELADLRAEKADLRVDKTALRKEVAALEEQLAALKGDAGETGGVRAASSSMGS